MTKPTLIYVYDPLCGWCFGFHPVMEKLAERFKDQLKIRVIAGGLAVDENAQSISEGYGYIRGAVDQVEQTTGVQFGENFKLLAEEGSYLYDSVPPATAQTAVGILYPESSLAFAGKLHNALFVEGKNLNDPAAFEEILNEMKLDIKPFREKFDDEATHRQTREQFEWCKTVGASAFPTLLLEIGNDTGLMSRGYRPYDTLESHLHHLIRNYEKLLS
ncbi:MAG: DsbA family protein [Balneolaceae bacterium]|nr:MAG: DsbA family protein [Balneolaceae bacterium]